MPNIIDSQPNNVGIHRSAGQGSKAAEESDAESEDPEPELDDKS